jgi:hypothetical protein
MKKYQVMANGATHPDEVVASGAINFDFAATTAVAGYSYTSSMQTMRIESGSADGTSQGKPKRIHGYHHADLRDCRHRSRQQTRRTLDRIPFRDSSMAMDQAVPLFTGDKEIEFPGGYDDDDRIYVRQDQPLPMTVLALVPKNEHV